MFSKNNRQMLLKRTEKRKLSYSIKKLSIGVASVLVGIYIGFGGAESGNAQVVNNSGNLLGSSEVMNESMEKPVILDAATEAPDSNLVSDEDAATEVPDSNLASDETVPAEEPVANEASNTTVPTESSIATRNATEAPINIDAIESGKVKTGGQLTNAGNIISGWLELAPQSAVGYTPGTGASTKLNGYTVNAQWIDTDGAVSPIYSAVTHNLAGAASNGGGDGVFAFELPTWIDETGVEHKFTYQLQNKD